MNRTIITAPALPPEALGELKDWLAITTAREDAALTGLLRAALDTCEGFTRALPLEAECQELLPASRMWQSLLTRPVQSITACEAVGLTGARTPLDPARYLFDITADGCGRVNLLGDIGESRFAVRFTAGLAPDWASLPDGIRQGIIRLAAHHYSERNDGGDTAPPAAIAALWQPWRRLRVA